jgi:transcriptional regulator with XRE-family HTH domain
MVDGEGEIRLVLNRVVARRRWPGVISAELVRRAAELLWMERRVAATIGVTLKQARRVRALSAVEAARAAGISAAYLSKLENDAVKRPSPHVLQQLSEALAVPYADLMRLSGYLLPGEPDRRATDALGAALLGNLTEDEHEELVEYLAWYRTRRRSNRGAAAAD